MYIQAFRREFRRILINTFSHRVYSKGKKQKINPELLTFHMLILVSMNVKKIVTINSHL